MLIFSLHSISPIYSFPVHKVLWLRADHPFPETLICEAVIHSAGSQDQGDHAEQPSQDQGDRYQSNHYRPMEIMHSNCHTRTMEIIHSNRLRTMEAGMEVIP